MTTAITSAHATNWVDDWFDAAVTTRPGVFESQQRTFATLGGFNGRISTNTDSIFTVSPPKINAGCGGIDIFMGGFSFLNPDYLVEKAEKIVRVAPYMAFDMALNELCTTCSTIKDRAESISNFLNGLQLDECKAAKPLALAMTTPFRDDGVTLSSIGSTLKTGSENLWNDAKKAFTEDPAKGVKAAVNNSSMSATGKSELLKEGSLLKNIGEKTGITTSKIAQMRALIGDVEISYTDSYRFTPINGCLDANYDQLLNGTPLKKGAGASASCSEVGGNSVNSYVGDIIDGIADKIVASKTSSYTTDQKAFISKSPVPIVYILNTAAKFGDAQLYSVAEEIKPMAARSYAFYMFVEMVRNINEAIKKYEEYLSYCTGEDEMSATHMKSLRALLDNAKEKRQQAFEDYEANTNDMVTLSDRIASYKRQQQEIDSILNDSKYAMGRAF